SRTSATSRRPSATARSASTTTSSRPGRSSVAYLATERPPSRVDDGPRGRATHGALQLGDPLAAAHHARLVVHHRPRAPLPVRQGPEAPAHRLSRRLLPLHAAPELPAQLSDRRRTPAARHHPLLRRGHRPLAHPDPR